jgi:hypothetical protein
MAKMTQPPGAFGTIDSAENLSAKIAWEGGFAGFFLSIPGPETTLSSALPSSRNSPPSTSRRAPSPKSSSSSASIWIGKKNRPSAPLSTAERRRSRAAKDPRSD